jgi:hypothetical protein
MAPPEIIRKLGIEFGKGITTEAQVVYLMAGIRKLLEQREEQEQEQEPYEYLNFYCDWALHSRMDRRMAQKILKSFDAANIHLREGREIEDLPSELRTELEHISKLSHFEREFRTFLQKNELPTLEARSPDGWVHFLSLYARVVEDCPLVMSTTNDSASIVKVTLRVDSTQRRTEHDTLFKVTWNVEDKNGKSGNIFIIFSVNRGIQKS